MVKRTALNAAHVVNDMDENIYHARREMSSHDLMIFKKNIERFRWQKTKGSEPPTAAMELGSAIHAAVLTPEIFEKEYIFDSPVNPKTGNPFGRDTKAFAEWRSEIDPLGLKRIINPRDKELIDGIKASVESHEIARELLRDTIREASVFRNLCGVECRARIDAYKAGSHIVDLKTTANITDFTDAAAKFNYVLQAAFYSLMLDIDDVFLIAVEKEPPYTVCVVQITEDTLRFAKSDIRATLNRYKECVESNTWPATYPAINYI